MLYRYRVYSPNRATVEEKQFITLGAAYRYHDGIIRQLAGVDGTEGTQLRLEDMKTGSIVDEGMLYGKGEDLDAIVEELKMKNSDENTEWKKVEHQYPDGSNFIGWEKK